MRSISFDNSFSGWRDAARGLIATCVSPENIQWQPTAAQTSLFAGESNSLEPVHTPPRVPAKFFELAERAACFDDDARWGLLYAILFRVVFENRNLLSIESDPDVRRLNLMAKAVGRDIHKFHAFVRFRRTEFDGKEIFVAWHEPQHFTVKLATPFFARRFGSMNFSILTPKGCAHWDKNELSFSAPASGSSQPIVDETEDFWLLYYRSIFNPFRLNVRTMKRELPVRHWPTLPEATLISELIRQAPD
jgi:DNA polymerase